MHLVDHKLRSAVLLTLLVAMPSLRGPGEAAATPFVIETADASANDVGRWNSLALDAVRNPHVSYLDLTTGDLKYARKLGGAWTIETADDGSGNDLGYFTSLALDGNGNPHVSYYDQTNGDLKYARKSGGVWTIETADESPNDVGHYTSLALDAQGNPHVSYRDQSTFDMKYAEKIGGAWVIEIADESVNSVGWFTSLALDAQGNPHVSYQTRLPFDLLYATRVGGVWTIETADGSANIVGQYSSLALDALGNPYVTYQDETAGDLKYAWKSGGVWTAEIADDGAANLVGWYTSLALDAQGDPHVTYQDRTALNLKYARKSGGAWTTETADGSADSVGYFTSLALDAQGNPHVTYLDVTNFDLKYAVRNGPSPIPGLFNTGVDGSGAPLADGSVDPHYLMIGSSDPAYGGPDAIVPSLIPTGFWIDNNSASKWIAPANDEGYPGGGTPHPEGDYVFRLSFDLAGLDPNTAAITGMWAADNGGVIHFNGSLTNNSTSSYSSLSAFLLDNGFVSGINDIDFVVQNLPAEGSNPVGLRVEGISGTADLPVGVGVDWGYEGPALGQPAGSGLSLVVFPNPVARGEARILFDVLAGLPVDLAIFDVSGRRVSTLVSGAAGQRAGTASWTGLDAAARPLAPGIYFLRLVAGERVETRRVTVIR